MCAPLPDWVPPRPLEGITDEGTTFVWLRGGTVRVFVDGEEVPRIIAVNFDVGENNAQVATIRHVFPDGTINAFVLKRPYSSAYEAGHSDA